MTGAREESGAAGSELAQTPLHAWHAAHGGRLVDFAGWSMPVQYTSIVEEHLATRTAVGLFDVSHMGRLTFRGPSETAIAAFLDRLVTRKVTDLPAGKIRYGLVTNPRGGILDDVLVYRVAGPDGAAWRMVVNASNRQKICDWIRGHLGKSGVTLEDVTTATAMIAVQGPHALEVLRPHVNVKLPAMRYYSGVAANVCGHPGIVSRTGYTGEDGCELIVPAAAALTIWEMILAAAQPRGGMVAGLAARDTLRLEAAMPLYGHELSESIDPLAAGLDFAVNFEGRDFIGRDALTKLATATQPMRRIGLELAGRRVPREGYPILAGDASGGAASSGAGQVGEVTSGTFSPTFQRPIAMGYVGQEQARIGGRLIVDIRGQHVPAVVVDLPFYRRP